MAKRIRYIIGDVFLIPLENELNGVGRVLNSDEAIVLIEFYRIKPIKDVSEFNYDDVVKEKPIVIHWCYDDALRKGEWKIISNKALEGEVEMPYFRFQDAGDMKYYIRKGSFNSFETIGERIEISKDEIHKFEPSGIGNEVSEKNRYIRKLREEGLM